MLNRFKRAVCNRKWAILLFPITGPIGAIIGGSLNGDPFNMTLISIYYFGIAIGVIAHFMAKDEYKELEKEPEDES